MTRAGYVGRFAPSPTGRLHMGSLLAAVGSFCDAKHHGGQWLVRMEDLDPPREVPGAADDILRTLEAFGLHWDGEVRFQSHRNEAYEEVLATLMGNDLAFGCGCTRKELAGHEVYPGHCSNGLPMEKEARSFRFRIGADPWNWRDGVQGMQAFHANEIGDFVVRRADGFWAYQLAVVTDDLDQGVTHVVRGADLLDSTPRQMALRQALEPNAPALHWAHLPVLVNGEGQKLSKQTLAEPVSKTDATQLMLRTLDLLGQSLPESEAMDDWVAAGDVGAVLDHAVRHWSLEAVPAPAIHWQGSGHD